jgi:hypothetical protein
LTDFRNTAKRTLIPLIGAGALALGLSGGAAASNSAHGQRLSSKEGTIVAKGRNEKNLRYSSTTVDSGSTLRILNHTAAPHSFSLIIPKLVPSSKGQTQRCFTQGHICKKIAKWHKFDGQTIHKNPVDVGPKGWSTEGSIHRKGDSVFYGPGQSPSKFRVSAPEGTVLHFICAIHPWMHGTLVVE